MSATISHSDAKQIVSEAFARVFFREPSRPARQLAQAVGWLETGYGQHWDARGAGSNNWGAIQAHSGWSGKTFDYVDTRPNADGTSTPYRQRFRVYASPAEGAEDLVRTVYTGGRNPPLGLTEKIINPHGARGKVVLEPGTLGEAAAFSAGLYDTVYYQGFGRTREERIAHHLRAVLNACAIACRETGEPMPDGSNAPPVIKVLRLGSSGRAVAAMQRALGLTADGIFGPKTRDAVIAWQRAHNIKPDGAWGPVCYHVYETEESGESVDAIFGLLDDPKP